MAIIRSRPTSRDGNFAPPIQIANSIYATIYEIGAGHITTNVVLWAINSQAKTKADKLTFEQVDRMIAGVVRDCKGWTRSGKGLYRWDGSKFTKRSTTAGVALY